MAEDLNRCAEGCTCPTFHITEQVATVVERTYVVRGADGDEAMDKFEEMETHEREGAFAHQETVRKNVEVVSVEEVSA